MVSIRVIGKDDAVALAIGEAEFELDAMTPVTSCGARGTDELLGRSLRPLFESVVQRCIAEGMVSADGFAVCASHALNAERGARSRGFNGAERS